MIVFVIYMHISSQVCCAISEAGTREKCDVPCMYCIRLAQLSSISLRLLALVVLLTCFLSVKLLVYNEFVGNACRCRYFTVSIVPCW